ncbi:MAG: D-amino-acid oxidase [Rhizobium sp. 63-7]|nr:MAG: D-amino-acid oxidase [Rhizobium sp. 63-7]
MGNADKPAAVSGQSSTELLIVGGGVMGLWAALHAGRRGIRTLLVDAGEIGGGASGGLLGALMPHMPDRWSEKKQFQFEALLSLQDEIATLEAETGLSAGYRRCGRLIPLPKPHLRTIALRHEQDAESHWIGGERRFHWHVLDGPPLPGWPEAEAGGSGFVQDTLAARVSPRGLVSLLAAKLRQLPSVRVLTQTEVAAFDAAANTVTLQDGAMIAFGHCVVSAGFRSFPFLDGLTAGLSVSLGQPVKGQAALLRADIDPGLPVIFRDGLYVVAHEGGRVAIGSTSENSFADPYSTDAQLDALIDAAADLVPALRQAEVVERWAGLRPKAIDRDPMVGAHPEHPRIIALTGGFKVSFGLAHRLAAAAVAFSAEETIDLPASFTLASHIAVARRST